MKLPASRSAGTTSPLIGIGLADRSDLECVHTHLWVVHLQLAESSVHDIMDAVNYRHGD